MPGNVYDTYAAAIQHDLVDLPAEAERVGVVRQPMPWFHGVVDRNEAPLGPPQELLRAIQERTQALEERGRSDAAAHNRAMSELAYDERYLAHLDSDDEAQTAMRALRDRLAAGRDIVLVCYEDTESKRCHRTLLRRRLERRLTGT